MIGAEIYNDAPWELPLMQLQNSEYITYLLASLLIKHVYQIVSKLIVLAFNSCF